MKLLQTMSDRDFFKECPVQTEPFSNMPIVRTSVRAILYNKENKIALVGVTSVVLPGGGVESNENLEDALRRECLEEVGCEIDILGEVGKTVEHRYKTKGIQESYCYFAKVRSEGTPQSTQSDEVGMKTVWCNLDEAKKLLDTQFAELTDDKYHSFFNIHISKVFLGEIPS